MLTIKIPIPGNIQYMMKYYKESDSIHEYLAEKIENIGKTATLDDCFLTCKVKAENKLVFVLDIHGITKEEAIQKLSNKFSAFSKAVLSICDAVREELIHLQVDFPTMSFDNIHDLELYAEMHNRFRYISIAPTQIEKVLNAVKDS